MEQMVKKAKAKAGKDQTATAYPHHSTISPKKFDPDTNSNMPPETQRQQRLNERQQPLTARRSAHEEDATYHGGLCR